MLWKIILMSRNIKCKNEILHTGVQNIRLTICMSCAWQEKDPLNKIGREWMQYVPLFLHSFCWNIEVSYYEQKNFWSLCAYMVRSK